ncbi:MAG: 30S ribosomal protein S12 methylthiotransferase RimO [Candidatus Tectomicrobia bacterium]|uniref:Ribosomal protein uS12 methylthiotransferase RimO n=1 Tax=Tectimicrobiota bacterium TaxID=2528274 RepID=A0A932I234_UNCTE|nr:30S ribosomal protein S12 methylthiotransferase RimO [Candidatus Tectomicrobia bacterium]
MSGLLRIQEKPLVRLAAPGVDGSAPRAALVSLGCAKNTVDSEIMLAALAGAGYRLVGDAAEADVAIVNTCGFIEDAKRESIDAILRVAAHKETGLKTLVVAGCLAERYRGELAQSLPEVDLFIGTREYDRLPELLAAREEGALPAREAFSDTLMDYGRRLPRLLAEPGPSAYLKVAEGCSRPCTFCVIPRFRGRFRSRPLDLVVEEAEALAAAGVREVNLLAQEITSYGTDLGMGFSLAKLLERLNAVEGLRWIRVLYNYPRGVTDELLDAFRELPKVVEYIDMPLQHVSTPVLAAMRRGIDEAGTRELVRRIKERVPGCALRTTMLVGFPGETEADFEKLLAFAGETRFARLGGFVYSPEEGSLAARLPDQVPKKTARARLKRLLALQERIMREDNRALAGTRAEVLVEGMTAEGLLRGRTRHQAPEVDGEVFLHETEAQPGDIIQAEIIGAAGVDLIARGV